MQRSELREARSRAIDNRVSVAGELLFALAGGIPGAWEELGGPGVGPAIGDLVDDIDEVVVPGMAVACSAGESREHGQNRRNWACRTAEPWVRSG
jgi:hypothetical protein